MVCFSFPCGLFSLCFPLFCSRRRLNRTEPDAHTRRRNGKQHIHEDDAIQILLCDSFLIVVIGCVLDVHPPSRSLTQLDSNRLDSTTQINITRSYHSHAASIGRVPTHLPAVTPLCPLSSPPTPTATVFVGFRISPFRRSPTH